MQFGIKTSPQYTTWGDMLDVWRTADGIDVFESAWNFDHFYPINVPDTTGPCMEGWVTLTALAQATSRIRIGCKRGVKCEISSRSASKNYISYHINIIKIS